MFFFDKPENYRFPSNIIYVDTKAPKKGQDGTVSNPFRTLKDAINKVNRVSTSLNPWGILLSPGNYKVDETITITASGVSLQGFDHSSSRIQIKPGIIGLRISADTNFHKVLFDGGLTSVYIDSQEYVRASYCYFDNTTGPSIVVDKKSAMNFGLTESRFSNCETAILVKEGSKLAVATTIFHGSGSMYSKDNKGVIVESAAECAVTNSLITHCNVGAEVLPNGTLITTGCAFQDCIAGVSLNGGVLATSSGFLINCKDAVILRNMSYCNLKAVGIIRCDNRIDKDAVSILEES